MSNAAKHDLDESSLVQEIQQLGLPKENSEAIARQYREHKDILRQRLSEESYRVSSLLSTDWRVDLAVSGSDAQPHEAIVHLKLLLDTQPHCGRVDTTTVAADGERMKEVAFEMDANRLKALIRDLAHAQSLMESIES